MTIHAREAAFRELAAALFDRLQGDEVLLLNLVGEESDFVRFNRARLRSAGKVLQRSLQLDLISGGHSASATVQLCGHGSQDLECTGGILEHLRQRLPQLPRDPFLNYALEKQDTRHQGPDRLPAATTAAEDLMRAAGKLDLVGCLASGEMFFGFANSLGQHNWHSDFSFLADWSVCEGEDAAVKQSYHGVSWERDFVEAELAYAGETLGQLRRRPKELSPGRYRVFLAPEAMAELMNTLGPEGFGLKSQCTGHSPLLGLSHGVRHLDERVTLLENHADGRVPRFSGKGFIKPDQVELVSAGRHGEALAASRSAAEYDTPVNCDIEQPRSLEMAGGELHQDDILQALRTGIYIANLWYCNLSDQRHCRITGLTRYACLWVENGEVVAPINVMRFDESMYRILGDGLLALSLEHELIYDTSSYGRRSEASVRLPGVLVDGFTLTL